MPAPLYDSIGINYADLRRPDPRIAAALVEALGPARTVVNIGAGTGSYEPTGREVTAVEPSAAMIAKRPPGSAPVVQASAEDLPFADSAFDAAMTVLSLHHWQDQARGLAEMRRVSRGAVVIMTFDPAARPWLTEYLPQIAALDEEMMPTMDGIARALGPVNVTPVPIPHDCSDGFLHAYWRRPWAYLDPHVRSGSSAFWLADGVDEGLERLRCDLESGEWERRYGGLLDQAEYDAGYRLVVSERS